MLENLQEYIEEQRTKDTKTLKLHYNFPRWEPPMLNAQDNSSHTSLTTSAKTQTYNFMP